MWLTSAGTACVFLAFIADANGYQLQRTPRKSGAFARCALKSVTMGDSASGSVALEYGWKSRLRIIRNCPYWFMTMICFRSIGCTYFTHSPRWSSFCFAFECRCTAPNWPNTKIRFGDSSIPSHSCNGILPVEE